MIEKTLIVATLILCVIGVTVTLPILIDYTSPIETALYTLSLVLGQAAISTIYRKWR